MISRAIWIISLLLLSVTFAAAQVCDPPGQNRTKPELSHSDPQGVKFIVKGTVVFVIDGDTMTVLAQDGIPHSVKFFGADAPELKQGWGQESADQLTSMVSGKEVLVDVRRSLDKSVYYGIVLLNSEDVGLAQIRNGMAWAYEPAGCRYQFENRAEYVQTESKSRTDRIGLWADPDPVPPWTYRGEGYFETPIDQLSSPSNSESRAVPVDKVVSPDTSVETPPNARKYILGPRRRLLLCQ